MNQHMMLAGFAVVAAAIGFLEWRSPPADADKTIRVTQAQRDFVREQISQTHTSGLSIQNVDQALKTWVEEEMLYREGMRLGLDKNDLIVKRRVVAKMRFLLEDMTPLPEPTEAQLQQWLTDHPSLYQTDQQAQFEHLFFSRGKRGDNALEDARATRVRLLRGDTVERMDPFPLDARTAPLTADRMQRELGTALAKTVLSLPQNEWSEPLNASTGVHLFRVTRVVEGRTMTLQEAAEAVKNDFLTQQRKVVNDAALAALRSTYRIVEE